MQSQNAELATFPMTDHIDAQVGHVETRRPVTGRFMFAYALAQYAAWLGIMTPVILTIALKVGSLATGAQKGVYLSTVLAIGAFGAMVACPIWGAISDRTKFRYGKRKVWLIMGSFFLFTGLLTMGLSTSLFGLAAGWLICQVGSQATQASLNALMPDIVPDHQQGRMSALLGLTINLAFVSGAFVTQFTGGNMLAMFLIPWLPGPFAIAYLLTQFDDHPAAHMPKFSAMDMLRTFWVNPIRHPDFGWAFFSRFMMFTSAAFFMSYQLFFLTDHVGVSSTAVLGMIFSCTLATTTLSLIFTPLSGWISDRLGRRKPLVFGAGIVVAIGLMAVSMAHTFNHFFIASAIYGSGLAVYYAVDIALCTAVLPDPNDAAKDMGVIQIANSLPQSLAPTIAPIFLAIGSTTASNYPAVFVAASLISLIGSAAILPIRGCR